MVFIRRTGAGSSGSSHAGVVVVTRAYYHG
jgi:hypothetical protein